MQSQSQEFSYFLSGERNLESVAEDYFSVRPVDEQDDQGDDLCSDNSSEDETDQEIDSDVEFDFLLVQYIRAIESRGICGQNLWMQSW